MINLPNHIHMLLRHRHKTFKIGDVEIRIRTPKDLEQFTDSDDQVLAGKISKDALPLFGIVWDSSEVLSHLMLEHDIEGKRILEVGCGMALTSHLLNSLGADITAMDIHPATADLIVSNVELNNTRPIPFEIASWSDEASDLGEFDLIVGSDVLYEPKHSKTLATFIDSHAMASSEVIIVDPERGQLKDFRDQMSANGFTCESFRPEYSGRLGMTRYEGVVDRYSR